MGFAAPFLFQPVALGTQCCIGPRLFEISLLVVQMRRELIPGGGLRFAKAGESVDALV
jgi:hypothetical protein